MRVRVNPTFNNKSDPSRAGGPLQHIAQFVEVAPSRMHFRFASPAAIARQHGLPKDEVGELMSAFPDEWGELLSEHRPGLCGAVATGDILTTPDGKHVTRVTDTPNGMPLVEESLEPSTGREARRR